MVVANTNNNSNTQTIITNTIPNQTGGKLSRELSEFLNNNLASLTQVSPKESKQSFDLEKTIDLSDLLIQDQLSYRKNMPISDLLSSGQVTTTTLNFGTTKATTTTTTSSISNDINKAAKALIYLQDDKTQDDENSLATDLFTESESTCDYDEVSTSKKRKAANIGDNIDRVKRLSTASTTSSSTGGKQTTISKRGGRRGARVRSIVSNDESEESKLARFGNKYVEKGTDEYTERRSKNNDAVKKCRAKLQEKQKEREQRLKELTEENRKLTNTVDSLNKELNVLKGILATMNPQYKMPNELEEKIKRLEKMIMANNNFNNNNDAKI